MRDFPAQSQEREICPNGTSSAIGATLSGLLAIVVIALFSGALWAGLHAIHVHAWWLFPLLLLGIGRFEADAANIA